MATALLGYFSNRSIAAAHGQAGRRRVERLFSLDAMVESYCNYYDKLLAARFQLLPIFLPGAPATPVFHAIQQGNERCRPGHHNQQAPNAPPAKQPMETTHQFAAFGNPLEDVGWIFAKCWRFAGKAKPAGGIAEAEDFLLPYQEAAGREVPPSALVYWQVIAHIRWAIIALQQARRHLSGSEPSLELALTGSIVAELEYEIVSLTR